VLFGRRRRGRPGRGHLGRHEHESRRARLKEIAARLAEQGAASSTPRDRLEAARRGRDAHDHGGGYPRLRARAARSRGNGKLIVHAAQWHGAMEVLNNARRLNAAALAEAIDVARPTA